ncbi:MAG: bacitracin ABC transporter permease [Treponematales bacterium]
MNKQCSALQAELLKSKHSVIVLISFIAFALLPIMGGVFMLVMQSPEAMAKASLLNTKMEMMKVTPDWNAIFMILTQGMGVGGIVIFGFAASWLFGREYSDNTVKDLLSLPVSKTAILNAKFIVYFLWAVALAIVNAALGVLIASTLRLPGFDTNSLSLFLRDYFVTTMLTILLGTPTAFFSMLGKGYLAPLGFIVLTLLFSQIIAAIGYGYYFPWSVPALFSGVAGEHKAALSPLSYLVVVLVSVLGYIATILYWKYTDHT